MVNAKSVHVYNRGDHFEVYIDGVFYCSADNLNEVADELEKIGV